MCVAPLSLGIRFDAMLDKSNPLMQNLPKHAAESMGNGPDGGLIAEAGHQTAEQAERLYKLLKQDGGKHLSPDVFMTLIDAIRSH